MIITKTTPAGKDGRGYNTVDFKATKKSYTAPEVTGQYEEDGKKWYSLANGNSILSDAYDRLWNPPKGKVVANKYYKGLNPDKSKL